jgi:putative ABC transport system substrate-binding protein
MRRREFITLLGGAAAAWPLAARAQQPAMPVVGCLHAASADAQEANVAALRKGLSETGFVEGRNLAIDYRYADNDYNRLPALVTELARRRVAVILALGGGLVTRAVKTATAAIPIVFVQGDDPVTMGLVASLNRPGGNVTGITFLSSELGPKRLGLLKELVPAATRYALLVNPNSPTTDAVVADTRLLRSSATSMCSPPAAFARSMQRSRNLHDAEPMRSWSPAAHCSRPAGFSSPPWPPFTDCLQSTTREARRRSAGS